MKYEVKTDVFSVVDGEWRVRIADEVLPTTWNSKGAATAGLRTECRRREVHELSRECWCQPTVLGADEINA